MIPKDELRALLRARRQAFVAGLGDRRRACEADLVAHMVPRLTSGSVVAGYVVTGNEIDPLSLLSAARASGCQTALPCIEDASGHLVFRLWHPGDPLMQSPFRFRQPLPSAFAIDPDTIVAPLLGFDRALGRIGQGKGYYDRAFVAHPAARRIGVAWSGQEVDALALDAWDVPLHGVATEREWIGG